MYAKGSKRMILNLKASNKELICSLVVLTCGLVPRRMEQKTVFLRRRQADIWCQDLERPMRKTQGVSVGRKRAKVNWKRAEEGVLKREWTEC